MDDSDNPYEILGLDASATPSQIRSAYRKAALRSHPDKQRTDADRQRATAEFAKISNAYELLSDPEQKRQYDMGQRGGRFGGEQQFYEDFFHRHHFHDPFQVFEQVFREEFGRPTSQFGRRDPFFDDMMMDPFGGSPSLFGGGSLFDSFSGGLFGGGMPQRSVHRSDPFEDMRRMHSDMFQQMQSLQQQQPQHASSSVYYSSSSSNRGGNGESVATQTTTKWINGKQQTVTERIVRRADGTVERNVERSGDEDFPTLETPQVQGYLPSDDQDHGTEAQASDSSAEPPKKRRGWLGKR